MSQSVTLKDIARETNLSVAAVSKALSGYPQVSEATRKRVLAASDQMNYKPRGRRTAAAASRGVKLVLSGFDRMSSHSVEWMSAFAQAAEEVGVNVELGTLGAGAAQAKTQLQSQATGADALLLFGCIEQELLDAARQLGVPFAVLGDVPSQDMPGEAGAVNCVNCDVLAMGRVATQALIAQGHTRIGFFCASFPPNGWNAHWLAGYRLAMALADLPDDPAIRPVFDTDNRYEVGVEAARYMAELDEMPTAFVVPAVRGAVRFEQQMQTLGIPIDRDQFVIGGTREEALSYGYESCRLLAIPSLDMARHALHLIARLIEADPLPPAQIFVPFETYNFDSFEVISQ